MPCVFVPKGHFELDRKYVAKLYLYKGTLILVKIRFRGDFEWLRMYLIHTINSKLRPIEFIERIDLFFAHSKLIIQSMLLFQFLF